MRPFVVSVFSQASKDLILPLVVEGVFLVVLLGMVRRSGRRADERVGTVMQALETRMDELAQELAGAVARAEDESRR